MLVAEREVIIYNNDATTNNANAWIKVIFTLKTYGFTTAATMDEMCFDDFLVSEVDVHHHAAHAMSA